MFKVGLISLGCDKNLVDSENILGLLKEKSYEIANTAEDSDVLIINTCCFIETAKEESINTILEFIELKKEYKDLIIVVMGCMVQRYKHELKIELPEVDLFLGVSNFSLAIKAIEDITSGKKTNKLIDLPPNYFNDSETNRLLSTQSHTAYVKIAEGCNNRCTYCIIPSIKGDYKSRDINSIINEVNYLVNNGVKEIVLIAQDTTKYGIDLYGKNKLVNLLEELVKIAKLTWIRLLYCYPENITDELIDLVKNETKICNYLDIPLQHSEDEVLKRMGRGITKREIVNLINKIRSKIPNIVIRTTLMVGFPGETEKDFNNLIEFVNKMKFDRLGAFKYSREEGTISSDFKPQLSDNIKIKRYNEIMNLQQKISLILNQSKVGKTMHVLIEGSEDDIHYGRTEFDAPTVDNIVYIKKYKGKIGDFQNTKIIEGFEYHLIGEALDES